MSAVAAGPGAPQVSVVIPTYNRRRLLAEAIHSVLAQVGCAYELIVVDDGSTDGTEEAMEALRGRGVHYVRQERRGVSAARNRGACLARAPWLAFLDSDDLWRPRKLAAQLAYHGAHPDLRISQTQEIWIRNGVRVNPCAYHDKPEGDIFVPSLARCLVSPSAVILRRSLFESMGGFDESLTVCEDYDLWLRIASRECVGLVREPLVVKRGGHADQLSAACWGMDRFRVAVLARLLDSGRVRKDRRGAVARTLMTKCRILARGAERRGKSAAAQRYMTLAAVYAGPAGVAARCEA